LDISQILRNFLPQFGAPKICTRVQISPCSPLVTPLHYILLITI